MVLVNINLCKIVHGHSFCKMAYGKCLCEIAYSYSFCKMTYIKKLMVIVSEKWPIVLVYVK